MCTYVPAQLCSCKAVQSSHSDILSISRVISVPAGGAKYGLMRLLELPFLLAKRPQQTDLATRREHLVYGNKSGKESEYEYKYTSFGGKFRESIRTKCRTRKAFQRGNSGWRFS